MMKLEVLPISIMKFDCRESVLPWSCEQCGFSSHVLPSLIRHKAAGCGSQKNYSNFMLDAYKCGKCEFISRSCVIATEHETKCCILEAADSMPLFVCSHCEFTISYVVLSLTSDRTAYKCSYQTCDFVNVSIEELKEHATFVHLPDECLNYLFAHDGVDSLEKFSCEQCGRELDSKRIATVLTCHNCGHKSTHQFGLRQRMMNKHLRSPVGDIQYFECQECPYRAKKIAQLRSHKINKHTPSEHIKWFECQECEYRSKLEYHINQHRTRKHNTAENIQSKTKGMLNSHKIHNRTRTGNIKWLECEECEFKGKTKSALKQHKLYKHTPYENIKWFECEECDYKGKINRDLKRHKIHKHTPN